MPPEQARGEAVDARADVYALGALLYHVLAGAPPFAGASSKDVIDRVLGRTPPPLVEHVPELAPDLLAIVTKAMARDPKNRYPTARAMADDLRRYTAGQLVSAHRYSIGTLVQRWLLRHRVLVAMAAALVVAVGITAGVSVRRIVRERDRADVARVDADRERATAVTQRDAAEKLGLFGELRQRLEALGKLDLLAGMGKEVLGYYGTLAPSNDTMTLGALQRRGAALDALAAVELKKRDVATAEMLGREAIDVYHHGVTRAPRDFDAGSSLVYAQISLARILTATPRGQDEIVETQRAEAMATEFARTHDAEPRAWVLVALARALLALAKSDQSDATGSRRTAADAREAFVRVEAPTNLEPEDKDRFAAAYYYVATAETRTYDYGDAAVAYRAHDRLRREQLASDPGHVDHLAALATGLRGLGFAEENDDHEAALGCLPRGGSRPARPLVREPLNVTGQYDQALALALLCALEAEWNGFAAGEHWCVEARAMAEGAVAARPDDIRSQSALSRGLGAGPPPFPLRGVIVKRTPTSRRRSLAIARRVLARDPKAGYYTNNVHLLLKEGAELERRLGHLTAAKNLVREADEMAEQQLAMAPEGGYWDSVLGATSVTLGDIGRAEGDPRDAQAAYLRAAEHFDRAIAGDPTDVDSISQLAATSIKLAALERDASKRAALRDRAGRR